MANSWQEVPLKEVAKPISRPVPVEAGTTYRTLGVKWWGMGAYEREPIDGSRTAAKTLSIVREGDLIINKIWVRHGSVAVVGKDVDGCTGSGEFPTFELDLNRIDPRWIHWQTKMKSFWEKCDDLSRGTSGKNRIKPELFLTINIPLPPLTEQRRIVAHIEALAARVNEAQRLREEAGKEATALLLSEENALFGHSKNSPYPLKPLGEVCSVFIDCDHRTPDYLESGVPLLRPRDIRSGYIDFSQTVFVDREEHIRRSVRHMPQSGDIVYSRELSYGNAAMIPNDKEVSLGQGTMVFGANEQVIDGNYLLKTLIAPIVREQAKSAAKGAAHPHVNVKDIRNFLIPVPPLDEQRRIVAYLDGLQAKVNTLRQLQSASREELSALMPSILDKAFKGEL